MDISTGVADLHLHTTASDGTCTLEDRINQAHKIGLSTIAITDHDTIANSIEYRVTHQESLEIITGVEIRADVLGTKIELLGYYINPNDEPLEDRIKQVRAHRRDRNYKIINQLNEITSLDRSYTNIQSRIDGILGRPHIANILIERDIVDSVSTAFEKYLGSDGAAFVPMERVLADEIINTIHEAGGVVSLAHSRRIRTNTINEVVERVIEGFTWFAESALTN
jgi:predicted metal-dependent phosphoesterase TrpH